MTYLGFSYVGLEVIFLKNLLQWSVLFNDVGVSKLYLDTNALQFFRGLDEFFTLE